MAQKERVVDRELKSFKKTKTGKAMNWLAENAKKSPGNGAGSRVIRDDDEDLKPSKPKVTRKHEDMNLSDESAGKAIGKLGFSEKSKEPLKETYRNRVKAKRPLNMEQEENSRVIHGGDKDDPRWEEHNKRKKDRYYGGK